MLSAPIKGSSIKFEMPTRCGRRYRAMIGQVVSHEFHQPRSLGEEVEGSAVHKDHVNKSQCAGEESRPRGDSNHCGADSEGGQG